jgi:hypothetical protein
MCIYFDIRSGSDWLKVVPYGIRSILNWIKKEYPNTSVIITENGVSDNNGSLVDTWRINYYRSYINEVLKGKPIFFSMRTDVSINCSLIIYILIYNIIDELGEHYNV